MQSSSTKDDLFGLKIGTILLIVFFLLSICLYFLGPERILNFFEAINAAERQAQQERQEKILAYRLQAKRNAALVAQESLQREEKLRQERELKEQRQRELIAKIHDHSGSSEDKQAKWRLFFKESPLCVKTNNWKQQVECADERMKAEQQFEVLYRDGKL